VSAAKLRRARAASSMALCAMFDLVIFDFAMLGSAMPMLARAFTFEFGDADVCFEDGRGGPSVRYLRESIA
jgi:hypothetical protein